MKHGATITITLLLAAAVCFVCEGGMIKERRGNSYVYSNVIVSEVDEEAKPDKTETLSRTVSKDMRLGRKYSHYINNYGLYYGVEPDLVRAIIRVESDYDPRAVSPKGAMGLMQLMPETAKRYGVKNPFEPGENILAGIKHLCNLMRRFNNNIPLVLAAYNAGEKAVMKYGGIPPYEETRNYVRKVTGLCGHAKRRGPKKTIYKTMNEDGKVVYSNAVAN